MSEFLDLVLAQCGQHPDRLAFFNTKGDSISYGQLGRRSLALACQLDAMAQPAAPVIVYGHKGSAMLTCMFACMRSGRPYVPVDVSFPDSRIQAILDQLQDPVALCTEPVEADGLLAQLPAAVMWPQLEALWSAEPTEAQQRALRPIEGDDGQYVLFTSGSTGKPKGVVQRAQSVDLTSRYFRSLLPEGQGLVCFNRAPFSFDLSIFDFLMALPEGHTMFSLEKDVEASLAATFEALGQANITVWVSTPSFLNMCLADPAFSPQLLPSVEAFVLCGETLHNATAKLCLERFPQAKLVNMYGPTETCGAVTDVAITPEMAVDPEPLPVGKASPFSQIVIADPETLADVPCGQRGEILILGDTAASGYYGDPDKTNAAFFPRRNGEGKVARCYRTGDEGFLDAYGQLHYCGRFDLQLKVNGYRIELGDIEENLNSLPQVAGCCVLPVKRNGMVTSLCAHVVPAASVAGDRHLTKALKDLLKDLLPAYMVPRTFKYHDALPVTINGKVDRKALEAEGSARSKEAMPGVAAESGAGADAAAVKAASPEGSRG